MTTPERPALQRKLGVVGAAFIGIGSMIGAGVFSAFGPATAAAGKLMLVALALAGLIAFLNASSSAQLASVYPTSGGTYAYGRAVLGAWWGFIAGWSFVVGKTASASAVALTFAAYAVPEPWQRPFAVGAVALFTLVNLGGITRTARAAALLVIPVMLVLLATSVVSFAQPIASQGPVSDATSLYEVLQAAGLLFFAFAGYARIATLGEEVVHPARTIRRAIGVALGTVFLLYFVVGSSLLWVLGSQTLGTSSQPVLDALLATGAEWAAPAIVIAVMFAALGALLSLIAGTSRTAFAMARERDLPHALSAVSVRLNVPYRAEIAVGIVVVLVTLFADLRGAIGFSSVGVLVYYFITNVAAWRQPTSERSYPRWMPVLGALLCAVVIVTLPVTSLLIAASVIAAGVLYRLLARGVASSR